MSNIKKLCDVCNDYRKYIAKQVFELIKTSDVRFLCEIPADDNNYIEMLKEDAQILDASYMSCADKTIGNKVKNLCSEYYSVICVLEPIYNAYCLEKQRFSLTKTNNDGFLQDKITISIREFKNRFDIYKCNFITNRKPEIVEDKSIKQERLSFITKVSNLLNKIKNYFFSFFKKKEVEIKVFQPDIESHKKNCFADINEEIKTLELTKQ